MKNFIIPCFIYLFNAIANVLSGIGIKYFSEKYFVGPVELIFFRSLIGLFIFLPFSTNKIKEIKRPMVIIFLGFLYSMDAILYNIGLKTIPVNHAVMISLLIPLWIILIAKFLLKESNMNKATGFSLILCFVGVYIFISNNSFDLNNSNSFQIGHLIIFINTILVALGLTLQKFFSSERPLILALFSNSFVLLFVCFVIMGFRVPDFHYLVFFSCLLLILLDFVEFAAVYKAYSMIDLSFLQPIRFTRIIFSIIFSAIFLEELTTSKQIFAAGIVFIANLIAFHYQLKKYKKQYE